MVTEADILNAGILVVDDNRTNINLLERMLRGAGHTSVQSTTDPAQVCDLYRQHRYSLILLDLQMPVMDGFEVMERLMEIEAEARLQVIVTTAEPGHKLRALKCGARDFLSKPLELAELRVRVHNLLEVSLLRAANQLCCKALDEALIELEASRALIRTLREE